MKDSAIVRDTRRVRVAISRTYKNNVGKYIRHLQREEQQAASSAPRKAVRRRRAV